MIHWLQVYLSYYHLTQLLENCQGWAQGSPAGLLWKEIPGCSVWIGISLWMDPGSESWYAVKGLAPSTHLIHHITLVHDSQNSLQPQDNPMLPPPDWMGLVSTRGQAEFRMSTRDLCKMRCAVSPKLRGGLMCCQDSTGY